MNLSLFLFFIFLFHPLVAQLDENQREIMLNLAKLLNGTHSTWDVATKPDPCFWKGVNCSSSPNNTTIISLSLSGFGVSDSGFLSEVCKIESLQYLNISHNNLVSIPDGFFSSCGRIHGLEMLDFSKNRLVGSLPHFPGFSGLEFLDLSSNFLGGKIDSQLSELKSLKSLNLDLNSFSGSIPIQLGKNFVLEKIWLSMNMFQGEIPVEMLKYKNLTDIDLSVNNLTGSIPEAIGDLSNLQFLILSSNKLGGEIPESISKITSLERFAANQNSFVGTVPSGITKFLKSLDLSYNRLNGPIPSDLLSHTSLQLVDLSYNSLSGSVPGSLSSSLVRLRLGSNRLNGTIPASFGMIQNLKYLELENNSFTGVIPQELGSCGNLLLLNLAQNDLNGTLPVQLSELTRLQVMKLQINNLGGQIPSEITMLSSLEILNISGNSLTGPIPSFVSNLTSLMSLNLQSNNLDGPIPATIGAMRNLLELQLGGNKLSGRIPVMPFKLQIALNLSSNLFDGSIPETLSRLQSLEVLDLSNNRFTGNIPESFTEMSSLTQLILTNNLLSGVAPTFSNHVSLNTGGNSGLIITKKTTNTSTESRKGRKRAFAIGFVAALVVAGFVVGTIMLVVLLLSRRFYRVNDEQQRSGEDLSRPEVIQGTMLTANGIHRSNLDFNKAMEAVASSANIVLKTPFSTYYKSTMPSGTRYFVKKLRWNDKIFQLGSNDKFEQELRVLGKLNNSNVMIPLAYTLTVDSAYLFYEFAAKGTLFDVLHGSTKEALDWGSRYSIAVGVAQGLAFLHGCSSGSILHLDLSSRNIMLRSLKEPQIADIELYNVIDLSKSTGSLSTVAGSVGYIPPEYAYTMRVTMAGNVYSFGVILLELLTRKPAVSHGTELAKWVLRNTAQHANWDRVLDLHISRTSLPVRNQMLTVLKTAVACVNASPEARPKMKSVLRMLLNAR